MTELSEEDKDFIEQMFQGYAEAAEWAESPEDFDEDGTYEGAGFCESAKKIMNEDCRNFYVENKELIIATKLIGGSIGQNLWLTARGHGTGFWDRGLGEVGDKLTTAAGRMEDHNVYINDDKFLDLE